MMRAISCLPVVIISTTACPSLIRDNLQSNASDTRILVVADPQIHNVMGGLLRQESVVADRFAGVARRRPELNILAPLVFDEVLKQGSAVQPELTLVLGDVSDIACTQEAAIATQIMERRVGTRLALFAHGNHDSYLMGTVNTYGPPPKLSSKIQDSEMPTVESWWIFSPGPDGYFDRAWPSACLGPDGQLDSTHQPMNKTSWIAKTISWLRRYGVEVASKRTEGASFVLEGSKDAVHALGRWFPSSDASFTRSYASYLVQLVDLNDVRVVVIDTSTCERAPGGIMYLFENAGSYGCFGDSQADDIRQLLRDVSPEKPVIVSGHFDISQVRLADRSRLLDLLAEFRASYISAHTHNESSVHRWSATTEFNVGSTTDWPMEAVVFSSTGGDLQPSQMISATDAQTEYERSFIREGDEYCRHVAAAQSLADAGVDGRYPSTWKSPTNAKCDPGQRAQLASAVSTIWQRISTDETYRQYLLSVAKGASYADRGFWGARTP